MGHELHMEPWAGPHPGVVIGVVIGVAVGVEMDASTGMPAESRLGERLLSRLGVLGLGLAPYKGLLQLV